MDATRRPARAADPDSGPRASPRGGSESPKAAAETDGPGPESEPPAERLCPAPFRPGLDDFLEALRVEAGLSKNTLAAYRRDLEPFLAWALEQGVGDWASIEADTVVDYLALGRREGKAEATLARRLSALRMALRHQVLEGRLERDPLRRISTPVLRRALPDTLTVDDVEALLRAPGTSDWQGERDTALLEVLYASGARVAEAVGLRLDAIEPSLRVLALTGKGNKTRIVPLGERARASLERWIEGGRRLLLARASSPRRPEVFLSRSGRPLDRTSAWRRVKRAARRAGLGSDISPHTLRHSFASHLIEGGADLRSVQEMLGHASIRTTEIYTHLDADHVRSLHRLYHPRG